MSDERLKLLLTVLSSIIFAMLFILLALVVPLKESKVYRIDEPPKSHLEQISKSMREY
jgi:type IV secretory pathway component VirB8